MEADPVSTDNTGPRAALLLPPECLAAGEGGA